MYIGDVGQDAREEVTFGGAGIGGLNHGWKVMEGTKCNSSSSCPGGTPGCFSAQFVDPIFETTHAGLFGGPCTIIGGYVYRGCAIPDLQGTYFVSDRCDRRIFSFKYDPATDTVSDQQERTAELNSLALSDVVAFGEDHLGEMYIVERDNGRIFKIVPAAPVALSGEGCFISVADGGTQNLNLDAGAANAGRTYVLLGSVTGTTPGLPVDSVVLPLNVDAYTNLTLTSPNPPLANSIGVLDGQGEGSASFSLGAGALSASAVGLTVHHAYALIGLTVDFASNAVPIFLDA